MHGQVTTCETYEIAVLNCPETCSAPPQRNEARVVAVEGFSFEAPRLGCPTVHPVVRVHPDASAMIVGDGANRIGTKSLCLAHPLEVASMISNEVAVFASHPEIAAVAFSHRDKAVGCNAWRVAFVEDGKSNAVELCNS